MSNRTTVKSNIDTLNVPSVTNAILGQMLKDEISDNVRFIEDVATVQSSTVSNITCNFTGKDRIDLTRTGGPLNITLAGIGDGAVKYLLINKSAGWAVVFTGGVVDVTPVASDVTVSVRVLYEITRKNIYYYARAWVGIGAATSSRPGILETATTTESNNLSVVNKIVTPGTIPISSTSQAGVSEIASSSEIDSGTDVNAQSRPLVVPPSELIRKLNEIKAAVSWTAITLASGWSGTLRYAVTPDRVVHLQAEAVQRTGADITGTGAVTMATAPAAIRTTTRGFDTTFIGRVSRADTTAWPILMRLISNDNTIRITPEPVDILNGNFITFYFSYIL